MGVEITDVVRLLLSGEDALLQFFEAVDLLQVTVACDSKLLSIPFVVEDVTVTTVALPTVTEEEVSLGILRCVVLDVFCIT